MFRIWEDEMKRIAIIGAGASGMFLANLLTDKNVEAQVFETEEKPLKKLLASGNGRCNFTNTKLNLSNYYGKDKALTENILKKFDNFSVISFFEKMGMPSKDLESGRVYPSTFSSKTVFSVMNERLGENIKIKPGTKIENIVKNKDEYKLTDSRGNAYNFDIVILAMGGIRNVKNEFINSKEILKCLGHSQTKMFPGIVQISTFGNFSKMKNQKFTAKVDIIQKNEVLRTYVGDTLFTDYGISGLSILQLSNDIMYALQNGEVFLKLDILHETRFENVKKFIYEIRERKPKIEVEKAFEGYVHREIIEYILDELGISRRLYLYKLRDSEIESIIKKLKEFIIKVKGAKSDKDGQITLGGVPLTEVNIETLESILVPNIYFTGEILDVQGESGGYNLQWAFSSAYAVYSDIKNRYMI